MDNKKYNSQIIKLKNDLNEVSKKNEYLKHNNDELK